MLHTLSASGQRGAPLPFPFFRIPCALMTDARYASLSAEAKLLYGLLLDRVNLSERNGWLDAEGRVYIYFTLSEIGRTLGCSKGKALRLLRDLETGVDLIARVRQGLGKPDRIYVFLPGEAAEPCPAPDDAEPEIEVTPLPCPAMDETEPEAADDAPAPLLSALPETEDASAAPAPLLSEFEPADAAVSPAPLFSLLPDEVPAWADAWEDEPAERDTDAAPSPLAKVVVSERNPDAQPSPIAEGDVFARAFSARCASGGAICRPQEFAVRRPQEFAFSDLRKFQNETSGSRFSEPPEVSISDPNQIEYKQTEFNQIQSTISPLSPRGGWESERREAEEQLSEQIWYERLLEQYGSDAEFTLELLTETMLSRAKSVRIGGEPVPTGAVQARFEDLDYEHIDYVLSSMRESASRIKNIRGYLLTALYRAPKTIEAYYDALVRHDFRAA